MELLKRSLHLFDKLFGWSHVMWKIVWVSSNFFQQPCFVSMESNIFCFGLDFTWFWRLIKNVFRRTGASIWQKQLRELFTLARCLISRVRPSWTRRWPCVCHPKCGKLFTPFPDNIPSSKAPPTKACGSTGSPMKSELAQSLVKSCQWTDNCHMFQRNVDMAWQQDIHWRVPRRVAARPRTLDHPLATNRKRLFVQHSPVWTKLRRTVGQWSHARLRNPQVGLHFTLGY